MSEPIRILQVLTIMNRGGAETMVMNYYRALDRKKYQFDFLVNRQERGAYDDEIESMGGRIFRAFPIRPWNYPAYFSFLNGFFKEHLGEFSTVHCHIQDNSGIVLKYAARYGIERRLCTSHIASYSKDFKYLFRQFGRWFGRRYTTHRLACGEDAGRFFYGDKPYTVIKNAIDAKNFAYDREKASQFRSDKGWENKLVIGNVSRLCHQKNHHGMVEIFDALHKKCPDSILVLVGDGDLRQDIEHQAKELGLADCVLFEGVQNNVSEYLNAFDVLLFPSWYEGLPLSIIEAQASGLRCFLSDTIDRDTDVTGQVTFLSLQQQPEEWADKILASVPYHREDNYQKLVDAGYDVYSNIDYLVSLYASK